MVKVLIAGGGTAGHVNPGLSIAKYLQDNMKNVEILFVGTKKGLETRLVPREGFRLELVRVQGFRRKFSLDTIKSIRDVFFGILDAVRLIKKERPDIVIGTGGYVCGPVLIVAKMFGVATLIHESNAIPGVTNKILGRCVDTVCISFDDARRYFGTAKRVITTGNPVRKEMVNSVLLDNADGGVVIFSGSRGSETINAVVVDMINKYSDKIEFDVTFATGEARYDEVVSKLKVKKNNIHVVPYIFNMPELMSSAKLMVTRSGAMTLAEITAMGKASVLIPSPYVTANHQEHNARALEKNGASVVILEKELTADVLYDNMVDIMSDNERMKNMAIAAKSMGVLNATEKIFGEITRLIGKEEK